MYRYVIVEVYQAYGEASKHQYRARPLTGQGLDVDMLVECSSSFRNKQNVGKLFKIKAKIKDTNMKPQLYSHFNWSVIPVSAEEAAIFIAKNGVK
ncbi:MAG TPA: hypothetical protein VN226_00885 [Anaerolineales bacterium]|nr:hypothetical protein [Anaerolineales bacterium]